MGRILWAGNGCASAYRPRFQSPDQWGGYCGPDGEVEVRWRSHLCEFQSPDQWGGYCGGHEWQDCVPQVWMFQSPDQWGGYCGCGPPAPPAYRGVYRFNPLTNGADIVGRSPTTPRSPCSGACFNPLTNGADIVGSSGACSWGGSHLFVSIP